jgi:hypothetical protein
MLSNVVKRTLGTWKKRFPILVHPLKYSLETQRDLVLALAVLHNIIINNNGMSDCFMETKAKIAAQASKDEPDPPEEEDEPLSESCTCEQARLQQWRDSIATPMCKQYQEYLSWHSR